MKLNDVRNMLKITLDTISDKGLKISNDILNKVEYIKKTTNDKINDISNNMSSKSKK